MCACGRLRSRQWRRCWFVATASIREWRRSLPGRPSATWGWPGGWPVTRAPGSGGADRITDTADLPHQCDDVAPPDPGALVTGQPPGQPHVALGRPGSERRHSRIDAVAVSYTHLRAH